MRPRGVDGGRKGLVGAGLSWSFTVSFLSVAPLLADVVVLTFQPPTTPFPYRHPCLSTSSPYHLSPVPFNHVFLRTPRAPPPLRLTPAWSCLPCLQSQAQCGTLALWGNRAQEGPECHRHTQSLPSCHSKMFFHNILLVL